MARFVNNQMEVDSFETIEMNKAASFCTPCINKRIVVTLSNKNAPQAKGKKWPAYFEKSDSFILKLSNVVSSIVSCVASGLYFNRSWLMAVDLV